MAFTPLKFKFDKELLDFYIERFNEVGIALNAKSFKKDTLSLLEPLELKDRVNVIADQFKVFLSGEYEEQLGNLVKILGPENEGAYGTFNDFFWTWPLGAFIERHGLEAEKVSLEAIKQITKRGTGEFAIRPFIKQNPDHLLSVMHEWSLDDNFHVRRLSSEGLRPKLPWASKMDIFVDDPQPVYRIITNLKNDPAKYVQTSVANMINDYFKVNNQSAMKLIDKWSTNPADNTKWIIKHAIRNYRKKGEEWALDLTDKMNQ